MIRIGNNDILIQTRENQAITCEVKGREGFLVRERAIQAAIDHRTYNINPFNKNSPLIRERGGERDLVLLEKRERERERKGT